MSAATASAMRTRAVAAKSHDGGERHFPSPLPFSMLLPPLWLSLVHRLVVPMMPPPLVLLTLPPPLNAQPQTIEAPLPLVRWCLSSCSLPLVCQLVVASPVVACLCLTSPFVMQLPHASILNPPSWFAPAGCCIAFAPPLLLNVPLPHDLLCCHHCQCAGIVAINEQASLSLSQLRLLPLSLVVELALLPLLSLL